MVRIAGSVSKSSLARELSVRFDRQYYFDPATRHGIDTRCNVHVRSTLGKYDVFYSESNLGQMQWYRPNQVLVGGIQPNMIIGMLLGAEFLPVADADADISATCLAGRDVERLPSPKELLAHPLVRMWDEQILAIERDAGSSLEAIPPFFWDSSGRAAVHGALTSGLKFCGDEFLMKLLVDPQRSLRLIDWLTEVAAELVAHFARIGRIAVRGIHVGECAACMIDVQSFRRFVVPATSRLGRQFGAVRFHSCGRSDHILEACRDIEGLASLDVGGETSVAKIRELFGREFPVGIAPLVEDMQADSPRAILKWYNRVVEENDQGDLTIGFHLEAGYRWENIRALYEAQ